ncbi:hypothetical protein I7X12_10000 [Halosimplex litoreum]|jgi:hypothetical protein|uniref:Uncharacterized protein n=1 Tax=Halosimplex litoreum TaxID=1198301 RepID=A0A7U3WBB4_9EURY|nr:hypothetical protein [Halosimplex litoreum]QPV64909.1 hypothetical protein I7X12_10000 [Halosimplex litoreum]
MSSTGSTEDAAGAIRETYEEYDVGDTRLAMIADPENEHAWIQSDVTEQIEQ